MEQREGAAEESSIFIPRVQDAKPRKSGNILLQAVA
jgi:hypothetical protein